MARRNALDPHTSDPRDPLELMGRLLVGSSYRVPVEGSASGDSLKTSDVAGAIGMMSDRVAARAAMAVATRAEAPEIARISHAAYRRVLRAVLHMRPRPIRMDQPADRWRLRIATYDAMTEMVWPERRRTFRVLAKEARMRVGAYAACHKAATSVLQEAVNNARLEFGYRVFAHGDHDLDWERPHTL